MMRFIPVAVLLAGLCQPLGCWAAFAAEPAAAGRTSPGLADYEIGRLQLGGDFTLTNQDGKRTSLKEFRSKVVLLFFGYTYCPDVCPLTMVMMDRVHAALGNQSAALKTVFVSIDPLRDTPARLKAYLANFAGHAIALTGSPDQIDRVAALYRVRFEKTAATSPGRYLINHTAFLYMLDGQGKLRYVFPPDADAALVAEGVRRLIGEGPSHP
ncbi:MAG: SCO family protein [SAR324 cluster bacterium]